MTAIFCPLSEQARATTGFARQIAHHYAKAAPSRWSALKRDKGIVLVNVTFHTAHFSKAQFADSWHERFGAIFSDAERANFKKDIDTLLGMFLDAKRDDVLSFTVTAQGLHLLLNSKLLGSVGDKEFAFATISGWLGDKPADAALRDAIFSGARVCEGVPCPPG
jgi:Chalcone isomerase-like